MIDWQDIDTVLLDMDGTLLDLHFDNFFWQEYLPRKWGERNGLGADAAKGELVPRLRSREGTLSWYCLDYWTDELHMDIFALKSDIEHLIQVRPRALEFLDHVSSLGKDMVLVTNAHERLLSMKLSRTGIGKFFDAVFSAHAFGVPKEDAGFWTMLQERYSFDPARALLIDDNHTVLRTAREYGIAMLLTIERPDSHAPLRAPGEFKALSSFEPLLVGDSA